MFKIFKNLLQSFFIYSIIEADVAFRNEIGDYYVRYEDAILIFYEDRGNIFVPEQIAIIRDKLR